MEIVDSGNVSVVDFGFFSLDKEKIPTDAELEQVVADIDSALKHCNAFFIKHHGIDQELIDEIIEKSQTFISLPLEVKNRYKLDPADTYPVGYLHELHRPSEDVAEGNGREAFLYSQTCIADTKKYPDNDVAPGWIELMSTYHSKSTGLYIRLIECFSLLLGLDRDRLCEAYLSNTKAGTPQDTESLLRINQFPPVTNTSGNEEGIKMRLQIHADLSMLTLLYITEKGLLVELNNKKWMAVDPQPGCILVQAGSVMHDITKGRIQQNTHCVVIPDDNDSAQRFRHSLAYFGTPDVLMQLTPIPELEQADGWEDKVKGTKSFVEQRKELEKIFFY